VVGDFFTNWLCGGDNTYTLWPDAYSAHRVAFVYAFGWQEIV